MMGLLASGGAGVTVSGALTEGMITAVQGGLDTLVATVSQVIPLVVPASISVIALTAGINYALKKVKGVISKAS